MVLHFMPTQPHERVLTHSINTVAAGAAAPFLLGLRPVQPLRKGGDGGAVIRQPGHAKNPARFDSRFKNHI
jgi:hypothetical protein